MQCGRPPCHNKAGLTCRSPLPCVHCISTASGGLAARASAPRLSYSPYLQLTCLHNSAPLSGRSLGDNDEFAVNFGEAVEVLRQDLPDLFVRDPRFHIFREDLTFRWAQSALQRSAAQRSSSGWCARAPGAHKTRPVDTMCQPTGVPLLCCFPCTQDALTALLHWPVEVPSAAPGGAVPWQPAVRRHAAEPGTHVAASWQQAAAQVGRPTTWGDKAGQPGA